MNTVNIKKEQVVDVLIKNRAIHESEYQEAVEGFYEQVVVKLKEEVDNFDDFLDETEKAIANKTFTTDTQKHHYFNLQLDFPRNYLEYYDTAIEKLEYSCDDVISLNNSEFRNFIQNKWDWTESFNTMVTGYSNKFQK